VVLVVTPDALGSGAIIDASGHVITNWHVVGDQSDVTVIFKPSDGTALKKELAFRATVEKLDLVADLALLKIHAPPQPLPFLRLGEATTLVVGQDVHAIGHPEGEVWTYTRGIISQIRANYTWPSDEDEPHRATVIQTQTPINPGNSGGPLLDDSGRLIGINSFGYTDSQGLNYAVAIDEIHAFLQRDGGRETASPLPAAEPLCTEVFDTTGRGWIDLQGCYDQAAGPPPDFWFVYRGPQRLPAYAAVDRMAAGKIDSVITSRDQQWQILTHHMDLDCNGTVDVIGHQRKGSEHIDSYRLPARPLHLVALAKELDRAFTQQKTPYLTLHVCQ
jgi:hypothetical protein